MLTKKGVAMEETAPPVFGYRRSHLKSETYRSLLRIISCCSSQTRLCGTAVFPSRHPISDDVSNGSGEKIQTEVGGKHLGTVDASKMHDGDSNSLDQNGSAVAVDVDLENNGLQDEGFTNTQAVINEIDNVMGVEDICGCVVELLGSNDGSSGNCFSDGDLSRAQQSLITELECALMGNEGSVLGSSASKVLDLTSVSKEKFGAQDNYLLQRVGKSGEKKEMPAEVGGLQESVCAATSKSSSSLCKFEDDEVEEGEISGKSEHGDLIIDAAAKTIVPSGIKISCNKPHQKHETKRKDSVPTSFQMSTAGHAGFYGATNDKGYIRDAIPGNRQVVVYEDPFLNENTVSYDKQSQGRRARKRKKDHEVTPLKKDGDHLSKKAKKGLEASGGKKHIDLDDMKEEMGHEPKENNKVGGDKNDINCKVDFSDNAPVQAHESSVIATAGQGTTLGEKDAGPDNNKKRGPPTAERKAKKKQKERKKRAEKNREQGVKRLKLRPVQVSKPVSYCRHFLKGRCQEGEKCKFSHDTIPLTKSTPCCHFARQSCMKGDDCPFDHQLFKYPCSKFVSEGSCKRGKACLFSHKVPLNEVLPSTSNVGTSSSTPPSSLLGMSDSKMQLDISRTSCQVAKGLAPSTGYISHKSLEQTATNAPRKQTATKAPRIPLQVPKGISILSHGKPLAADCNHLQPTSPATKVGSKCGNQSDQSASGKVQSLNETPIKRPPKGINFLSFCRSPLGFPPSGKINRSPVNHSSPAEVSAPDSSLADKLSRLSAALDERNMVDGQVRMSQAEMKSEFMSSPLNPFHSSVGETSVSSSELHERPNLLNLTMVADKSAESIKTLYNKGPTLSAYPCALTTSPSGLGRSPYNVGQGSNPVQKALMSTLAFAAKLESEMKLNRSASAVKSLSNDRAGASGSGVLKDTPPSTSNI